MQGRAHRIRKALSIVLWLEGFLCNDAAAMRKANSDLVTSVRHIPAQFKDTVQAMGAEDKTATAKAFSKSITGFIQQKSFNDAFIAMARNAMKLYTVFSGKNTDADLCKLITDIRSSGFRGEHCVKFLRKWADGTVHQRTPALTGIVVAWSQLEEHRAIKGSWKQLFEFTTGISTRTDDNKYMLTLDEFDRVVGHHADCDGYANPSTGN